MCTCVYVCERLCGSTQAVDAITRMPTPIDRRRWSGVGYVDEGPQIFMVSMSLSVMLIYSLYQREREKELFALLHG